MTTQVAHDWIAKHVFYASDATPIIVEAIRPLVARLREQELIDKWFFIKYWMDGPHVRLRLHPRTPQDRAEVDRLANAALEDFLTRRPALYDSDPDLLGDLYQEMFLAEYSQEEWDEKYGADGRMPMQPNNSVVDYDYEPEFDRYGGTAGMEIAEWHFEASSDMTAMLLATSNPHVRPVLLGLGTQLSLMTAYAFLRTDEAVARFFDRYRYFWEHTYGQDSSDYHDSFEKTVTRQGLDIRSRMDHIRRIFTDPDEPVAPFERQWIQHCRELQRRVSTAAAAGHLTFADGSRGRTVIDDPEALATVLLSSYVHMTNNRLGLAILDEIYLSYLIERAQPSPLQESA